MNFGISKLSNIVQNESVLAEKRNKIQTMSVLKYDNYVEYLESKGWRRQQLTLDELNTNIVTLQSVDANTTDWAIEVKVPANQKITVMGTGDVSGGADAQSAHSLRVRFADSSENELAFNTKVRITKEKPSEESMTLARVFYADINLTKQAGNQNGTNVTYKNDPEWYRFKQGIQLSGEQRLKIYITNTLGTIAQPEIPSDVLSPNVSFALDCDLWNYDYYGF